MTQTVRTAHEPAEIDALRREADLLRRCAHPGVAELARFDDDGVSATLITIVPGQVPLSERLPDKPTAAASLVASLADTVADLHSIGVAGLGVRTDNIVIGDHGRPCLATLAGARLALDVGSLAADLHDLAALADELADALGDGRGARALRGLAAHGRGDDLNARAMAHAAAELARRPLTARGPAGAPVAARAGRVALAVLALGVALAWFTRSPGAERAGPAAVSSAPTRAAPANPAPVIARGGDRYVVGVAGDVALVGDWDCGGERVALLRPATGDVFVFDGWATADAPLSVKATVHIPGAHALRAAPANECSTLIAVTPRGEQPIAVHR